MKICELRSILCAVGMKLYDAYHEASKEAAASFDERKEDIAEAIWDKYIDHRRHCTECKSQFAPLKDKVKIG